MNILKKKYIIKYKNMVKYTKKRYSKKRYTKKRYTKKRYTKKINTKKRYTKKNRRGRRSQKFHEGGARNRCRYIDVDAYYNLKDGTSATEEDGKGTSGSRVPRPKEYCKENDDRYQKGCSYCDPLSDSEYRRYVSHGRSGRLGLDLPESEVGYNGIGSKGRCMKTKNMNKKCYRTILKLQ